MKVLEQILQEIENWAEMVRNIPTSEDEGNEFPDGEQCYEDGRVQGRYEELLWMAEVIRFHMEDDGWIPVEERLPDPGVYLVSCDDADYPVKRMRTKGGMLLWP